MKRPIRVLGMPNSSGSGYWRIRDPFYFLEQTGKFDCRIITRPVDEEVLNWADIIITQSLVDKNQIARIYEWQQEHGLKWIMEQDDYPVISDDNPFKLNHDMTHASEVVEISLRHCDLITASTSYLANELEKISDNVIVLPNYMNMDRWDIKPKLKNEGDRIRLLWAGSITHMKDMEIISDPITKLEEEFPSVELYCIGDIRMSNVFKDVPRVEFMLGTDFASWPTKLSGVRADIGLAPLQDALFARCKSWIKPLEYAINEIPALVSNVEPYKPLKDWEGVHLVDDADWYVLLRELIKDKQRRIREGNSNYKRVKREMDLKSNINKWVKAYQSLL